MRAVGVKQLKNRLSEFLRLVRAGEVVLVTDREVVIAELRPPESTSIPSEAPNAKERSILDHLIETGLVNRPKKRRLALSAHSLSERMPSLLEDLLKERSQDIR